MSKIQAVFIDRDGTIGGGTEVEYPGELVPYAGVLEAIQRLKQNTIKIFSFTNQPGIANKIATKEDFELELMAWGFDDIFLCPHSHGSGCDCRKPAPGMLENAAVTHQLTLEKCVVIGDRWTDLIAADQAGCRKILVKTGAGADSLQKYKNDMYTGHWRRVNPDHIAETLPGAINWILKNEE